MPVTPATLPWRLALRSGRDPVRSAEVRVDRQAFDRAYRQCQPDLSRYVRSIVRSPDLAEDVLQTVMVKALAALAGEQRDFELRPWLFRIAHNEAIDALRRTRPADELDARVAAPDRPISEQVEARRRLAELWADLEQLPERQRQALVLRELSGLGHAEIGAILGTDARAVKQTIFEARQALLEYARGREMQCAEVQRTLSDGDGRVRRGRRMRAHIRACTSCRAFDLALGSRPAELAALVPLLPVAGGAGVLAHGILGGTTGSLVGGGGAAASGASSAGVIGAGSGAVSTGALTSTLAAKAAVVLVSGAVAAAGGTEVAGLVTAGPRATPAFPAITGVPPTTGAAAVVPPGPARTTAPRPGPRAVPVAAPAATGRSTVAGSAPSSGAARTAAGPAPGSGARPAGHGASGGQTTGAPAPAGPATSSGAAPQAGGSGHTTAPAAGTTSTASPNAHSTAPQGKGSAGDQGKGHAVEPATPDPAPASPAAHPTPEQPGPPSPSPGSAAPQGSAGTGATPAPSAPAPDPGATAAPDAAAAPSPGKGTRGSASGGDVTGR